MNLRFYRNKDAHKVMATGLVTISLSAPAIIYVSFFQGMKYVGYFGMFLLIILNCLGLVMTVGVEIQQYRREKRKRLKKEKLNFIENDLSFLKYGSTLKVDSSFEKEIYEPVTRIK